jgi:hypothetical protein
VGSLLSFLPVVGTKVITKRLAVSSLVRIATSQTGRATSDVKLLTIRECVDSKTLGVEELPAATAVLGQNRYSEAY